MTTRRNPNRKGLLIGLWLFIIGLSLLNHAATAPNTLLTALGAALGAAIVIELTNLWRLLFGRLTGYAVLGLNIGSGRRLAAWRVGGMPVSLRWYLAPPLLAETVLVRRPAPKLRLWLSTLLLSSVQIGLGLWLAGADTEFVWALSFGVLFLSVLSLALTAMVPLTPGWVLFRMPFLPADALERYSLTPAELAATRALRSGRLGDARAALADAADGFQTYLLRAVVAVGEGRYADASNDSRLAVESAPHRRTAAPAYFIRATALVGAAETGELPPAEYLLWLDQAIDAGQSANAVVARFFPGPADLALLEGRLDDALKLARKSARLGLDPFWQAQSECTYAAALAANGRPNDARAALERARRLMPELARIETVAARTGSAEATGVR